MTRRALPIRRWWVLFGPADDLVQPAFRGSVSGVGAGGADVALGGGHRFVTQQVHQDVYADICVGQFGDEGMPKAVQQDTLVRVLSMPACRKARSTRYCRVPRVMRWPSPPTNNGADAGQAASPPVGEGRRVVLGNRIFRLSGYFARGSSRTDSTGIRRSLSPWPRT